MGVSNSVVVVPLEGLAVTVVDVEAEDRAAIMAGVDALVSGAIAHFLIGRSPSVVCREIARHTGPDGQYRRSEAARQLRGWASPEDAPDCDEVLRCRVIADLSQGHTPARSAGACVRRRGTLPSMDASPTLAATRLATRRLGHVGLTPTPKTPTSTHLLCLRACRMRKKLPIQAGCNPIGMWLIDERPFLIGKSRVTGKAT